MEFRILGPFEVRRDGEVVDVAGAKARAVLAMLVLHANQPVSAERLAIAVWGKEVPGAAVNAVQAHVSRVRRALGADGMLVTTPGGYCLQADPDAIDAWRFERLLTQGDHDSALALWRGPALADFADAEFAQAEIVRLEEMREQAIEARIDTEPPTRTFGRTLDLQRLEALLAAQRLVTIVGQVVSARRAWRSRPRGAPTAAASSRWCLSRPPQTYPQRSCRH